MKQEIELFEKLKNQLLNIDPVAFCQKYLTLDGKPFRLSGNGYKPFSDIYRYIGIKALEPDSKPIVLVKGRQVGGTTMASALEMYFMGSGLFGGPNRSPIRIIHAFPDLARAEAFSKERLHPMIMSSLPTDQKDKQNNIKSYMQNLLDHSNTSESMKFKQFLGGNTIKVDSTGIDGGRLRGGTADVFFFDEVQDITAEAIGNTVEMLKQSKYGRSPGGVQVYFGTPKNKGSNFYKMWQVSNQQYYHLGCLKCKEYFPLYTPESDEWEKIWIHGFIVKCPHCGLEQDKNEASERGKWITTKDINDFACKMVGFHINQFYMPHIKREDIDAERPQNHYLNTERKFRNEVLGEFYQGDTSPISIEEIIKLCGDKDRHLRTGIAPQQEQMILLGIDYGAKSDIEQLANPDKSQKRGQSFTTAVVLTVKGPSLFYVDFAHKFIRNDPTYKKGIIDNIMRKYSVDLAIGDIGFSNDFSIDLHREYGDKYLVSRAHNKINGYVKYNKESYPKEIIFERDYYIAEVLELLKKGQIRFPLKDWDRVFWLVEHCCSMELKPSISKYGDHTIHYVKGSTPNDGFMALLNAYIAYKFMVTKGFTNNNPLLQNQYFANKNKPLIVTGYIPRKMI